ncbi:MAG: CoA transferase [Alphaproteobacteria bacterium]|jgi:crotonobetainyl-CoA:carnitine CoA-transferase CaiB-like acyl-CoA transferase|nr:CoA transferase [Alphaproteobacteria bacterium]
MTANTGALAGVKVVDLGRVLAGPYATQILGDHGADVIKVEPPQGDETREWGPPFRDDDGERGPAAYYVNINRNKRGMALDLTKPEAREVVFKLLEDADVLVENFKIGTMEKWGMGFDVLSKRFPRLIHARVSGFGAEGPLGGMPGYDAVLQAMTGLSSCNGSPESGPIKLGVPMVDMTTGLNLVIGILLALNERHRSGLGQFVEVALYDAGISILHPHSANWLMAGRLPSLLGNAHPNLTPYELFATATRPIHLGVGNDPQFKKLLRVVGLSELIDDPRFKTMADRNANRAVLIPLLREALAKVDGVAIAMELLKAGVPAGTLNTIEETLNDPQTKAREMLVERNGYRGIASPVKMSRSKPSTRHTPPDFGVDNRAVLREAGYDEAAIDGLVKAGAVLNKPQ